jgi:hypothetical protein
LSEFKAIFGTAKNLRSSKHSSQITLHLVGDEITSTLDDCLGKEEPAWGSMHTKRGSKRKIGAIEGLDAHEFIITFKMRPLFKRDSKGTVEATFWEPFLKMCFFVRDEKSN